MEGIPQSMWVLERVVIGGLIRLHEGETKIGRNTSCDITVASDFVSRVHAKFQVAPGSLDIEIEDLGSTNGIFVNGKQFNNTACKLQAGDRIGIGVSVDDDQVTSDGRYPMFVLRHVPLVDQNNIIEKPNKIPQMPVEEQNLEIIPRSSTPSDVEADIHDECAPLDISDNEYDEDDDVDDFVQPQSYKILENGNLITPATSSSSVTLDSERKSIVSANIQTIFGYLNPELLSNFSKDTREIAEAASVSKPAIVTTNHIICISSDEECDDEPQQKTVKSPQLFGDSFNNDDSVDLEKEKEIEVVEVAQPLPISTVVLNEMDIPGPVATSSTTKVDDVDANEEEELYFTQKLFDDLREELPDSDNDITSDYKVDESGILIMPQVKQEKFSQSADNIINLDDDDDEYDEVLESKVNHWSNKLFSQSFSNSFSASQVYEDDVDCIPAATTEGISINIEDDDEEGTDGEQNVEMDQEVDEPQKSVSIPIVPSPKDKENSVIVRQWKRSSNTKFLFSSSSSDEDHDKEKSPHTHKKPSSSSKNREKEVHTRKLSTTDEIPQKKLRLSSKSEGNETENITGPRPRRQSSSSKSSDRRDSQSSTGHSLENDLFDKLRDDEKESRPSSSDHKQTDKRTKSRDSADNSKVYRRSSSAADGSSSKMYMSATIARRKSLGNHAFLEEIYENDIEEKETKKPEQTNTTQTKMIRGPPAIITPPLMPVKRGKLRGVSAVQKRCIESIKGIQAQNDLKRKWKEKPSIAKRKEQMKCKAIKEDRKQKLKELADKKNSDATHTKTKVKVRENDHENAVKIKNVKVTEVNRGAFLTEETPRANIKSYKIPKASAKLSRSSSTSSETSSAPKLSNSKTAKPITTPTKATEERKSSTEVATSFSMELLKADEILQNNHKRSTSTASRDRQKSTDLPIDQRERAPPRRNNKKLTFDAMEQHFVETNRLQSIQIMLAKASSMKSPIANQKKKKTVRFNDVPQIRYIEPVLSATRKVNKKELSTFNQRRNVIRARFPLVEQTDHGINEVLIWSQRWLQNNRLDESDNRIFPMTNQFTSINNYKNTVFPLLKIEFLSHLERYMERYSMKSGYDIRIDYFTVYKDRELLFAKCTTPIKQSELGPTDLALIEVIAGSSTSQYFGYIGSIRKTGTCNCITIEVSQNLMNKDMVKSATKITIRRIMEGIRVHFGSFNAVHQLEQTPLFQKILNPLELLNVNTNRRPPIKYKGHDVLNTEQTDILLKTYTKTIDNFDPNISLIKGPPGTGKSRLITNLAIQLLYGDEVRMLDKKILICAQSNLAVDVIAQQLYAIQKKRSVREQNYMVIRFGKDDKVHKDVKDITVSNIIARDQKARLQEPSCSHERTTMGENLRNEILKLEARVAELQNEKPQDVRQDELIEMKRNLALKKSIQNQTLHPDEEKRLFKSYLENANIICTTLSSCVKLSFYVNYFDVCIIDEATQCIEPWTIMPLKFGVSSLILVGDTQQLPATVISQKAKEYGLGMSLFTRIQNCLENNDRREQPSPILSLHTQYRMHPEICQWPNMYFYKNQLLNAPITAEFKSMIKPFSILNLDYRQNDKCYNGQIANSLEAEFVAKLVKILNLYIPNKFYSYGVITPYAQHREKLEAKIRNSGLNNIMINTIDSYQGIEKDVIIISNARTQGIGFFANYQRLNVALTRPKKCLILCGNFKNLESVPSWASLLANARQRGLFHDISTADAIDIEKNVIEKIKIKR